MTYYDLYQYQYIIVKKEVKMHDKYTRTIWPFFFRILASNCRTTKREDHPQKKLLGKTFRDFSNAGTTQKIDYFQSLRKVTSFFVVAKTLN